MQISISSAYTERMQMYVFTPCADSGNCALPFGWMKATRCPADSKQYEYRNVSILLHTYTTFPHNITIRRSVVSTYFITSPLANASGSETNAFCSQVRNGSVDIIHPNACKRIHTGRIVTYI
jgi:hypothetical protein